MVLSQRVHRSWHPYVVSYHSVPWVRRHVVFILRCYYRAMIYAAGGKLGSCVRRLYFQERAYLSQLEIVVVAAHPEPGVEISPWVRRLFVLVEHLFNV